MLRFTVLGLNKKNCTVEEIRKIATRTQMLKRLNTEYFNQYKKYNLLNIPLYTSYTIWLDVSSFVRVRQH